MMDSLKIKVKDTLTTDLAIQADGTSLGSQYDNFAKQFVFERPAGREEDSLILLFRNGREEFEPIDIGRSSVFPVPDSLTQDTKLTMQIAFERGGKLAHSDLLEFSLRASLPAGRAPTEPWPRPLEELLADAYVRVSYLDSILSFYNMAGEPVDQVTIASGGEGVNGWSPVLSLVEDGSRAVLRVEDWVGGSGVKPASGGYIAAHGLVGSAADALNVKGPSGAPGAAATVAVGTTTTLPAGSQATVTNTGTAAAAVFNFGIPAGADGAGGQGGAMAVSDNEPDASEGMLWADTSELKTVTPLASLALGSEVQTSFDYNGEPIVFNVVAKNFAGYPQNSVTLLVKEAIAFRAFDASESRNTDSGRRASGNNRYLTSNLRRWLNSDKGPGEWYEESHEYDAPPAAGNLYLSRCPYEDDAGFLHHLPESFRAMLMPTDIVTPAPNADGGGNDLTTDLVFPPTQGELTSWGISTAASRIKYPTRGAVNAFSGGGTAPAYGTPCAWSVRAAYTTSSTNVAVYSSSGVFQAAQAYASSGTVFVINLPADTPVATEGGKHIIKSGGSGRFWVYTGGKWSPMDNTEQVNALQGRMKTLEESLPEANPILGRYRGMRINCLGDSITVASGVARPYTVWLASLLGAGNVTPYAVGGTTIAKRSGRTDSFLERYPAMGDADLIVVFGGLNDCTLGISLGTAGNGDVSTFAGALEALVGGLVAKYPDKSIIYVAPGHATTANNSRLPEYIALIRQVCRSYSVPVLDTYACAGICPSVPGQKAAFTTDGIHPNDAGHERLGRLIAAFALNPAAGG